MKARLHLTICIAGLMVLGVIAAPASPSPGPPRFDPPKAYYLALGDSITYGFQASKLAAGLPPSAFDTGYVDVFAARIRALRPGLTVVNYGCPGESTASFISGPCLANTIGLPLHDPFGGSQLAAAVAFLHAHPGSVSPITLTLWANDVRELVQECAGDLACVQLRAPTEIARLASNLRAILAELRAAAPSAEIVVTGVWDTFLGLFALADPMFEALNAAIAGVTADADARFADPFPIFNPRGDAAAETAAICTLTLLCTDGDSHPSDAGYRALAAVVFDASGYARRLSGVRLPSTATRHIVAVSFPAKERCSCPAFMRSTSIRPMRLGLPRRRVSTSCASEGRRLRDSPSSPVGGGRSASSLWPEPTAVRFATSASFRAAGFTSSTRTAPAPTSGRGPRT
jgi:lysophospholipase L1-like esterase